MTDLLERAITTARALPSEMQDDVARIILSFAGDDNSFIELTPEEEADLIEADAEVARGELATDERMRSIWAKHRL